MTVLIGATAGALAAALTAFLMLAPQRRANRQIALARAQLALASVRRMGPRCPVCRAVDCDTCHECQRLTTTPSGRAALAETQETQ